MGGRSGNSAGVLNRRSRSRSITINYVHIPNNTQNFGAQYGQDIEPAGKYISYLPDNMSGNYRIPGYEYGKVTLSNPLILDWKSTGPNGWKKDLSERYGGKTGKALSNAIMKDGYDSIVTKDGDDYMEIVLLQRRR